jgi:hypothetical protein
MPGDCYFGGPRFLNEVRDVDPDLPQYGELMETLRRTGKSTSRRDYFRDTFMALDEERRVRVVASVLDQVRQCDTTLVAEIRAILAGGAARPVGVVTAEHWNAERLNRLLGDIDTAIGAGQYERAVGLSYTCLEGFYGAFFRAHATGQAPPSEIIALSRWVRDHLRGNIADYPDEVLNLVGQTAHAVDRARNRFSEAHFAGEAGRWLATYMRDLVNSQVRLLLHFM